MSTGQWAVVLRHVQRLFQGGSVSGLSEGQLLDRFVTTRDELAFGAIVARHGPMVLGVCRGVLDDPHDVEDAFQATFLVLVKKAAFVRDRDLLGQWLYGVARRVSLRARSETRKRRAKERPEAEGIEPIATLDTDLRELQFLIREEVDRLSSDDRIAVVLCYLEGLTHEEAADRLGWPVGTVKGRLSRAREKLRGRLTRRGVALPAAAIVSTLAQVAKAAVPIDLIRSTTLAATSLAAGKTLTAGIVSAHAIALMEGVIGTMFLTKLKIGATALVAVGVLAVPGVLAYQGFGPEDETRKSTAKTARPSQDLAHPEVTKGGLANRKTPNKVATPDMPSAVETVVSWKAWAYLNELIAQGKESSSSERVHLWARRLAEARSVPGISESDRMAALKGYRDRMQKTLNEAQAKDNGDDASKIDVLEKTYRLLEADRWLRDGTVGAVAERQPMGRSVGPQGGFPVGGGGFGGGMARVGQPGGFGGGGGMTGVGMPPFASGRILNLNKTDGDENRNDAIRAKLEEKISMNFANPTPFTDIKKYIEQATQDEAAGFPTGLPLYIDPEGLEAVSDFEPKITMASTVTMKLEGVPLRTTLRLLLRQLGLDYRVDGGVILISDIQTIVMQDLKEEKFKAAQ